VRKNMQLMAEEVIPHFREPDGKPTWARHDRPGVATLSEHAASVGKPERTPVARLDGGELADTRLAYIPDIAKAGNGAASGDGAAARRVEKRR
jgi:hypothetical protein